MTNSMANNSRNMKVFETGLKKMQLAIERQLVNVGKDMAITALMSAVDAYDADSDTDNLTGNTRMGFASAAFYNGKMICGPYSVMDFDGGKPTSGFVRVGYENVRDYDHGQVIPKVRDYRPESGLEFQSTLAHEYGYRLTMEWIKSGYKPPQKGLCVVVANRSTYVDYLRQFRDFDILETESDTQKVKKKIQEAFGRHPITLD